MGRSQRDPWSEESERDWLVGGPTRPSPWALAEELGPGSTSARQQTVEELMTELATEREQLAREAEALREWASRIADLERRLEALTELTASDADAATREAAETPGEPDYLLCRCEGFEVDSPEGRVGVVDGLRYVSRIDRPDFLEVRAGLFGRERLLIRVEDVSHVLFEEGRLVLRTTPRLRHELVHELVARLRSRRDHSADAA